MDLSHCSNQQLRACLQELKDKTSGSKQEMILRLQKHNAEVVKTVMERLAAGKSLDTSVNLLDVSSGGGSGEDTVANLTGEVAILKQTMQQLVQQLKSLIPEPRASPEAPRPEPAGPSQPGQQTIGATATDSAGQTSQPMDVGQLIDTPESCSRQLEANGSASEMNRAQSPLALANSDNPTLANFPVLACDGQNSLGEPSRYDLRVSSGGHADVRDIIRIMPDFCPGTGLSSAMFIERVNQLSRAYGWSEQMLLYAVYDKLKGPARQWMNAMPIFNRWADFVQAFLADFPCDINTAELNIRMMRSRMNRSESYVDYFYKMLALGRSGNMQDSAIVTYVINGLYDDTMKKILSAMHFPRCADLLRTLMSFNGERRPTMPNVAGTPPSRQQNIIPKVPSPTQKLSGGIMCFRCRERGHMARNCQKFRKPSGVNNINASKELCEEEENVAVNNIAPTGNRRELLKTVTIVCNPHVSCKALIDSGSGRSLIKRSVANKCASERTVCNETLSGFAGGKLRCTEKIDTRVELDKVSYPAELLIVEDGAMKYDVLIGIDVLANGTVIIEKGVCRVMPIDATKLDVGEELPKEVVLELKNTLNTFAHCFGEELKDLGKSTRFKMEIRLTSDKPVIRKPYPIPIPKQRVVERIINELLELGIIQPSRSAYSSPIVLVKKQNGEDRLCVDYRQLNSITEKQPWHMPTVDGVLATLSAKKYFTTLDMMSGYYQLELEDVSKPLTAFVTHNGHFEFCRMPFGLRNAPSAFQRMMAELIAPLGKTVTSYVDEVIIATETAEANIEVLRKLLQAVELEGLTLRSSKCSFLKHSVTFLGHKVDGDGVRPGGKTISALREYPAPGNQQEVRRFLGLAGFFRKFVPNFAIIAKPLSSLLKKDANFMWGSKCEGAFRSLIHILTEAPVLVVYDVNKGHQLHTDASGAGLAAILLQKEDEGLKPIAYFSRACTEAESKYHAYELEVLAVVEACERFRTYLLGKQFSIVTDCHSIASAKLHKPMIPRIARWFLKLMEYDYNIIHRPGESMRHVDAMSRAPMGEAESDAAESVMQITTNDWVSTLQREDPSIKSITDTLNGVTQSGQRKQLEAEYCIRQNRLFRRAGDHFLLVVPRGVRWRLLKLCHDDAGHPGVDGTIKRIAANFWFPRMRNFAKGYIKSCIDCIYYRQPQIKNCELYGMEVPKVPFEVLHMDHLGPFVKSKRGNEFILVIVDALSRYSVILPVKSTKTKPVVDALDHLTLFFGLPRQIVTDRGTAFTSTEFAKFCNVNNIQHTKVAVRTPRANGLAERVNQAVLKFLKPAAADQRTWDCQVRMLQWTLNTTVNATTKMSPMDLIFDFPLRDLSGNRLLNIIHDDAHVVMTGRRNEAISRINDARNKWKKRFDAKHRTPVKYREGSLVLLEVPVASTGESKKLQPSYRGPYEVKKVLRFDRYVVGDIEGLQGSNRKFSTVAASDKMKPWCSVFPELDDDYVGNESAEP